MGALAFVLDIAPNPLDVLYQVHGPGRLDRVGAVTRHRPLPGGPD
jgi:hypothetical protein